MENNIYDGMKKEGKRFLYICIVSFIMLALSFLLSYLKNKSLFNKDMFIVQLILFTFIILTLYYWIYSINYNVIINQEKISVKSLFSKKTIRYSNIESYKCKRYFKSNFYMFTFAVNGKKHTIYTRYKNELVVILNNYEINMI